MGMPIGFAHGLPNGLAHKLPHGPARGAAHGFAGICMSDAFIRLRWMLTRCFTLALTFVSQHLGRDHLFSLRSDCALVILLYCNAATTLSASAVAFTSCTRIKCAPCMALV